MELKAYAKINLSLNVTSLGNMHALDSVMVKVDLCDTVFIEKSEEFSVNYGMNIEGGGTVKKAYDLLSAQNEFSNNVFPISVKVDKKIPIGGGLGGSSADASAIFRFFNVDNPHLALKVGSDVPFMSMKEGCARVEGLGEKLTPVLCPNMSFVFLNGGSVMTRESFGEFDKIYKKPYAPTDNERLICALKRGELADVGKLMANALYLPSSTLNPNIIKAKDRLLEFSPLGVVMTGSGGGVIALFESKSRAERVAKQVNGITLNTLP